MGSPSRNRTARLGLVGQFAAAAGMVVLLSTCATPAVSSFGADRLVVGAASCPATSAASAPDPIVTDGDKYHVVPDGAVKERDFKPGDAIWMPEQVHTGENIGTTDTDFVIVKQKSLCSPRRIRPSGVGVGGTEGKS
ncbi:MAG: hypothetical protein WCG85_26930 [Polyangia bacterium]